MYAIPKGRICAIGSPSEHGRSRNFTEDHGIFLPNHTNLTESHGSLQEAFEIIYRTLNITLTVGCY
jgi:hypothetical protein